MRSQLASERLRDALAVLAFPLGAQNRRDVERRVWDYVDFLKALGWPSERVIFAVNQVANEAGLRASSTVVLADAQVPSGDELLIQMTWWCIERYYHDA